MSAVGVCCGSLLLVANCVSAVGECCGSLLLVANCVSAVGVCCGSLLLVANCVSAVGVGCGSLLIVCRLWVSDAQRLPNRWFLLVFSLHVMSLLLTIAQ